jgi:uncharacterized damage-inducible protein DinB
MTELLGGGLIPRHQRPDRELLLAYLQRQRELVHWKCAGLDEDAARAQSTPTGLTIHAIVAHLAGVERGWIREHFAGGPRERVRDDEFAPPQQTLTELLAGYREECARCDEVIAAHDLDETSAVRDHSLRWILLHLVEEIGRHLGHLDLLCELADGRTGEEPDDAPPPGVDEA